MEMSAAPLPAGGNIPYVRKCTAARSDPDYLPIIGRQSSRPDRRNKEIDP